MTAPSLVIIIASASSSSSDGTNASLTCPKNELRLFLTEFAVDSGSSSLSVSPRTEPACDTSVRTAVDISSKSRLTASKTETDYNLKKKVNKINVFEKPRF